VAEPSDRRDRDKQAQRQREANRRQRRHVGDQGAAGGGDRDRDSQCEVDDQGTDRQERPGLSEGAARRLRRAAALGKRGYQLPVVEGDEGDDPDHQAHRRDQQVEVAAEGSQGGLDRVGNRRDRVGHHRKGKGHEQHRLCREAAPGGA
jgi:hypothetical protein